MALLDTTLNLLHKSFTVTISKSPSWKPVCALVARISTHNFKLRIAFFRNSVEVEAQKSWRRSQKRTCSTRRTTATSTITTIMAKPSMQKLTVPLVVAWESPRPSLLLLQAGKIRKISTFRQFASSKQTTRRAALQHHREEAPSQLQMNVTQTISSNVLKVNERKFFTRICEIFCSCQNGARRSCEAFHKYIFFDKTSRKQTFGKTVLRCESISGRSDVSLKKFWLAIHSASSIGPEWWWRKWEWKWKCENDVPVKRREGEEEERKEKALAKMWMEMLFYLSNLSVACYLLKRNEEKKLTLMAERARAQPPSTMHKHSSRQRANFDDK